MGPITVKHFGVPNNAAVPDNTIRVVVPEGGKAGDTVRVPYGNVALEAEVPAGHSAGMAFFISKPNLDVAP